MNQTKKKFLKKEGLLNSKPERIKYPLFNDFAFFDSQDLSQVRYEMLRSARVEKLSVTNACKQFGFSREYFYKLERTFDQRGFSSLLGSSIVGCRPVIALNQEIVAFIAHKKIEDPKLSGESLRKEIYNIYKVNCSRRTVERIIEKLGMGKKTNNRS